MKLATHTRALYPEEIKILKATAVKRKTEIKGQINYANFLPALFTSIFCTTIIIKSENVIAYFLFVIIALFSFSYLLFRSLFILSERKALKEEIQCIDNYISYGNIVVNRIKANRIAVVEGKDFGDAGYDPEYYIIELNTGEVLFHKNYLNLTQTDFPCLEFDIYSRDFSLLTNRVVFAYSGKINPIIISADNRYCYEKIYGQPHFGVRNIEFDKLTREYNNCA
ncbi:hypothetical protein ACTHGU_05830 [Chitinophagaceae bacterium MMS25-I14]